MAVLIKPKSKRKGKPTTTSSVWHICFWDRIKKRTRLFSTMCRKRKNAERRLRQFIDMLESGEYYRDYAPNNPFLVAIKTSAKTQQTLELEPLLAEYEQALATGQIRKRGKGKPPQRRHVALVMSHIRKITEGMRTATDISPEKVQLAIARHTSTKQTAKHYGRAIKAFSAWLCSSGRLPHDPLVTYQVAEVSAEDVVHNRGPFSWEQVCSIVKAARESKEKHRGLSPQRRALLWGFAAGTGFRMGECAEVRKRDFGPELAYVVLAGVHTKNDKVAKQPLPPFVRSALLPYLATLADEDLLWGGKWANRPVTVHGFGEKP